MLSLVKQITSRNTSDRPFGTSPRRTFYQIDEWLLQKIYQSVGQPPIGLTLKAGPEISPTNIQPVAEITIRDRRTLLDLILDPDVGFGDAYGDGRITVEGDLIATLEAVYQSASERNTRNWYTRLISHCLTYVQRNSLRGARKNIHRHYDLNNDFFRLWLDPQLVYSCAYFPSSSVSLEEAQVSKMDYICRKLNLQPGERAVDVGSGWGALALHMAKHYGATVRAFSISHEQVLWARRRAMEMGLSNRVEFVEDDYRNISGKYDVLASVGMLEHVGAEHYDDMGRVISRSLDYAGRGLVQTIGRNRAQPFSNWIRKRIFPGAYAPSLHQIMEMLEPGDFSILDVENLRPHYARTLEHWLQRFENSAEAVSDLFGSEFARTWRLYLAGAIAGFRTGALQLFQIVFARNACQQIPSTRAYLYREEPLEAEPTVDARDSALANIGLPGG